MKSYNNHISRNCCKVTPNEISCQYCYKTFTRNYNKNLHETTCSKNINSTIIKQCKEKDNKIQILQEEIAQLKQSSTINVTNINGNITNTQQNITNTQQNIIINNFGGEDISHITNKQILKALRMNKDCPVELIKLIHFNVNKPENHNIYKPNFKDKYVKYCDNNVWKIGELMKVVTELYLSKMDLAEEKFEELKHFLEETKKDRFQQLLDNREEPDIMGEILKRIIEILYNERNVVIERLK